MRRFALFIALGSLAIPLSAQGHGRTFFDDFESGVIDYDVWTRGGRDLSHTGVVDVASRAGSLTGHVYHRSFTETTLYKEFEIRPDFSLSFDMEVRAVDPGSPGWTYNSFSGANIELLGDGEYGRLEVIYCTSGYRQALLNSDPKIEVLQIVPGVMSHFTYTLADLQALLPGVDLSAVSTVRLTFQSYCSWWNGSASGDVWFDNVHALGLVRQIKTRSIRLPAPGILPLGSVYIPYLSTVVL